MVKAGILGATGYTARELIHILLRHEHAEIVALTTRQEGNVHVSEVHPQFAGRLDLVLEPLKPDEIIARCDCVFSCLPHAASAERVKPLVDAGIRVVDLSADYRLQEVGTYTHWYREEHPDPERVGTVAYGLPELFFDEIAASQIVANPGCNPTAPILALAPLLKARCIQPADIIVDAKCGVSGAGRSPKLTTHFPECNENVVAYNVGHHRHTPEFNQVLQKVSGASVDVLFIPHLVPMDRGILTTTYATACDPISEEQVLGILRDFYHDRPFVRVVDNLPTTKQTLASNYCDLTARVIGDRVVLIGSIDNLWKGASAAAVQNFNVMYGFEETTGLCD